MPKFAKALHHPWDVNSNEFSDIWSGEIITEAREDGIVTTGRYPAASKQRWLLSIRYFLVLRVCCFEFLMDNRLGVTTKYSLTPSLSQILNIDKQNRKHPFWILLSDITPGPSNWCDEDTFLTPLQLEMKLLNEGKVIISSFLVD